MGAINKGNRFVLPDNFTHEYLIPYAFNATGIAVEVNDACYYKGTVGGGDVAYPADQLVSLGTEALDQITFAKAFVGYSQQKILLAEVNTTKKFVVRTDGVMDAVCPSQTWKHGDLVGIFSNGVTVDPQQVDKVTQLVLAFGICVKDFPNPSTRVTFRFSSRFADEPIDSLQYAASGEMQSMNNVNNLTDANQVFTVASPFFSQMSNTGNRTIKLPLEAAAIKLQFWVHNLAASTGTITFQGSAGSSALGTAIIPAGKFGMAFCDGLTWYSNISA